jgi:putative Mn2+ efflux pump MntP
VDDLTLFAVAVALGADAFAVSAAVAAGLPVVTGRHTFRLAWHFGLFQGMMTVIGWFGGAGISTLMAGLNHWIAFSLLLFLGGKMIYESRHPESRAQDFDPTRGLSLIALSVATSIDALAVGISLSLVGMSIWRPALLIALMALVMSFIGTRLGKKGGELLGSWAEVIGGVVLILIGVRILAEHLLGGSETGI